jgi:hypothetical protein
MTAPLHRWLECGLQGRTRRRPAFTLLVTLLFLLFGAVPVWSQIVCKPLLSLKSVREVRMASMPAQPWRWSATIATDARHCATQSGAFEIDFVRIKENSPDLQFTEKLRWQPGAFEVSMELTSDEAILDFRIGFIAPCVCRPVAELSLGAAADSGQQPSSSAQIIPRR